MIRGLASATPQEILLERARRLAGAAAFRGELTPTVELLCFRIAAGRYALSTRFAFSALQHVHPAALPGAPEHVVGIIGVQGDIVPAIDLARFWGSRVVKEEVASAVVVGIPNPEFAVIIDGFDDMVAYPETELIAAPASEGYREFVSCVMSDGLAVLDGRKLLDDSRLAIHLPS